MIINLLYILILVFLVNGSLYQVLKLVLGFVISVFEKLLRLFTIFLFIISA